MFSPERRGREFEKCGIAGTNLGQEGGRVDDLESGSWGDDSGEGKGYGRQLRKDEKARASSRVGEKSADTRGGVEEVAPAGEEVK